MPYLNTITFPNPHPLPFPQVIYLQTKPVEWDTSIISNHHAELSRIFGWNGDEYIYLPDTIKEWHVNPNFKELATFNNPKLYSTENAFGQIVQNSNSLLYRLSCQILDYYQIPLSDFVGFLYFQNQSVVLIEVDSNLDIDELKMLLNKDTVDYLPSFTDEADFSIIEMQGEDCSIGVPEKQNIETDNLADELFPIEAHQLAFEISERLNRLKRSGFERLVIESLSQLILPSSSQFLTEVNDLSKIEITPDFRILLSDYGNLEVELTPLPKVVFLFFLRHPEGVLFKKLFEHRQELLELYKQISLREDMQAMYRSIDELIDPTKNSINEKCSRIKEAFIKIMDDSYAQHYYITGARGVEKSITINRNLVVWKGTIAVSEFKLAKTKQVVDKEKTHVWIQYNKANDLRKVGNRSEALKILNEIIRDNPYFNHAYILRAIVYLELQNYSNAITDNTRAIELNHYTPEPYYNRGLTYFIIGSFKDALVDISHYIEIKGEEDEEWKANAYKLRGDIYLKLNQLNSAIPDYQRAISLGNEEASQTLGKLSSK